MPKICVVGGGRWGKNHVRTLDILGLLGGICDVSDDNLKSMREQYPGCQTFPDLELALEADFDGFVVATPAETHQRIAIAIMRSGYPVLVEKPLALSSEDARKMHQVSLETGQSLMVGHLMLFHPAIKKIKSLIDEGKIGRIQHIYSNRLNLGTVRTEENILWSFAPHDISIFQYLLGDQPVEVVARGGAFLRPEIHDSTITILKYPKNVVCHNYVSWLHPFKEHRLVLVGSKGMVSFDDASEDKALLFYEKGIDWVDDEPVKRDGATEKIGYGDEQPLTEELKYFTSHLHDRVEIASSASAIEVLEILERATVQLGAASNLRESSAMSVKKISSSALVSDSAIVHESAYVDADCQIDDESKIWHFCHIQKGVLIGKHCSLGQNVNVGNDVVIGNRVRIQNNVSVFEGVELEDDVFCGPSMTFTNVLNPRAMYPVGASAFHKTLVKKGASIGANATIVCGNTIGCYSFIAAGAVVTDDVPDYAFMIGVPARQDGWVTQGGARIRPGVSEMTCEISNTHYTVSGSELLVSDLN